jgi:hypothetical protein
VFNTIYSSRENFLEGFGGLDMSGSSLDISGALAALPVPVQQPSSSMNTSTLATAAQQVQDAKASGTLPAAAPAPTTVSGFQNNIPDGKESFENLFDPQYANASHWSSSSTNFFKGVPFKPECCQKSDYSSSTGCACLNKNKQNMMRNRGGY